jgi:hypothetical protein
MASPDTTLFFRRLALFVTLLAVPFGVLESVSRRIYADDTRLPAQKAHFEAGAVERAETLVLGMSYLWRGVNPEFLERPAYNLAFSHQDFYYSWRLFERYLPRMKALKVLVLGMDINTVAYSAENTHLIPKYYSASYGFWPSRGMDLQFLFTNSMFWVMRDSFVADVVASRRAQVRPAETIAHLRERTNTGPLLISGYEYSDDVEAPRQEPWYSQQQFFESRGVRQNLEHVDRIAALARTRGVTIVLLTPPWDMARTPRPEETKKFHGWVRRTFVAGRNHVAFLDHTNTGDFSQSMFSDGYHLNYEGATLLTKRLQQDLEALP